MEFRDTAAAFRRALLLTALMVAVRGAGAADLLVGTVTRTLKAPEPRPLSMPTAVAVDPARNVYVLDGVNDRMLVFEADGEVRELRAADVGLNQPIGLEPDGADGVWVADSGNHRLVRLSVGGSRSETMALPARDDGGAADPSDVALSADGRRMWVADNDGHRLLLRELPDGPWKTVGLRGESLGQFQYPLMLAVAPSGDLVVTDVINGRAQVISPQGQSVAAIGEYGVEPGELFRPTGVAVDRAANVWVSDSVTGVIQTFRMTGEYVDVLRGESGEALRFDHPMGLAFGDDDTLYVVELGAHRVAQVQLRRRPRTTPAAPVAHRARVGVGTQARGCTVCHIDWLPTFLDGHDSPLMARPVGAADDPVAARGKICLSCHDGSVGDSRHRVWLEHGHRTGVEPPAGMRVPPNLPLLDGKVACRTCHSAHGPGAGQGDMSAAVLLRVPNQASELCISCHADKTRGPAFGTHPTGGMPWPVPQTLVDAGAKLGPNPRELTCQVCHTPHGAREEHLLVKGTGSNELCIACHEQMRPGMFREGGPREHPLSPPVNEEQAAAVAALGTKLSPDGKLVCLSCHKLHHGKGERFMLADELTDGQMCLQCHSQRREMLDSPHDLRRNLPHERNRLGMSVQDGGPCSACHLFHRLAREPLPTPADPRGVCMTCHQAGRCAERAALGDVNHPSQRCTDCHDPHNARVGKFLREPAEALCVRCHADQAQFAGGPHDPAAGGEAWSPVPHGRGCLACHRPHGDATTGLFRVAPLAGMDRRDGACLACHADSAWHASSAVAALHPRGERVAEGAAEPNSGDYVLCRTCHDPHAGAGSASPLLRASAHAGGATLCIDCHPSAEHILLTAHAPDQLSKRGYTAAACGPCHTVHGHPGEVGPSLLAAVVRGPTEDAPRASVFETPAAHGAPGTVVPASEAAPPGHVSTADALCVQCHREGGAATNPGAASHPDVPMFSFDHREVRGDGSAEPAGLARDALRIEPTDAGLMLYAFDGRPDALGRITCRTCHLSHGREPPAGATANQVGLRLQLRPFEGPNLCTSCHGADGLRRFLYFHDAARRGARVDAD